MAGRTTRPDSGSIGLCFSKVRPYHNYLLFCHFFYLLGYYAPPYSTQDSLDWLANNPVHQPPVV